MNGFAVDIAELRALAGPLLLATAVTRLRAAADHATGVLMRDAEETAARLALTARPYEQVDICPA